MLNPALLSLALTAGVIAAFSPCSIAMVPTYVAYLMSRPRGRTKTSFTGPLQGAKIGAIVSLGFTSVFLVIGALASFAGAQVEPYLPWMAMGVGVILIVLGVLWLLKVNLSLPYAPHVPPGGRYLSFFIFGATYAIASAACVFPVFLMIVFAAVSSGEVLSGLVIFLAYSLGMAVVMIPLSIAVSASRDLVLRNFTRAAPLMRKIGAVILIIAGTYLIYLQSLVLL